MQRRPELYAYALAGLAVVCSTILAGLGQDVPDFLPYIALGATTAGAGVSQPSRGRREADPG